MADSSVDAFRGDLLSAGILDPLGIHHEFKSGLHGRKLDFGRFPDDSPLFTEWVRVVSQEIETIYFAETIGRVALVGVATGGNRIAKPVAQRIGALGLESEKKSDGLITPTFEAAVFIKLEEPELIVVLEDVGTTGSAAATLVQEIQAQSDTKKIEVVNTWQRSPQLTVLDEADVVYHSVIFDPQENFTPEECLEYGYCARGWEFIPREA